MLSVSIFICPPWTDAAQMRTAHAREQSRNLFDQSAGRNVLYGASFVSAVRERSACERSRPSPLTFVANSSTLSLMKSALAVCLLAALPVIPAELKSGPPLPYKVVKDWAQLPAGWNFGECSGVAVD